GKGLGHRGNLRILALEGAAKIVLPSSLPRNIESPLMYEVSEHQNSGTDSSGSSLGSSVTACKKVLCSNSLLESTDYWLQNQKTPCRIGIVEDQLESTYTSVERRKAYSSPQLAVFSSLYPGRELQYLCATSCLEEKRLGNGELLHCVSSKTKRGFQAAVWMSRLLLDFLPRKPNVGGLIPTPHLARHSHHYEVDVLSKRKTNMLPEEDPANCALSCLQSAPSPGVAQGGMVTSAPCTNSLFCLSLVVIITEAGQPGTTDGRNINNLRYADDTTLTTESEEEVKSLLMRVKEQSAKVALKLNIKKTKIMASGPLTSWQIVGEEMEVVTDFIFLGSKITADGDCSQEIKRRLLLGRKAMVNLDSILKSRDITLPTKVCIVKAMVFPVAMYGCESWTIRKAECQRIEAFELWCWRRLLQVPWTARRSNWSVLGEINPDCSLEGQILKMKLKYFGLLMRRKDSLEKSLMLGTIDSKRRRGRQRMRWLDGVTEAVGVSLSGLRVMAEDRKAWRNVVHGVAMGRT
ncbi:A-kinase anchor protein SPHKAP, partial [Varanus komodoensis]